ncbi:MAG: VOC family protein, partial [Bryobacteraceae bacterium]
MPSIALATLMLLPAFAQPAKRPAITGLAHIALQVKDIEQSRVFYKDFLGFTEPFDLKNADGSVALTFIKVNDRQYIELFPERGPATDRLHHISIETTDAEALRKYLASRGVPVPERVPKGRSGNSNFNVKDPDGHTVEIVQYEPDGWSMREKGRRLGEKRVSTRMLHFGILVYSTEASMKFYRDILGFEEAWRGSRDGKTLDWINLRVPDGTDYLELMLYKELPAPDRRGVQHHICLEVGDMDKAVAALSERKVYT